MRTGPAKVALVTGAARGIGLALGQALLQQGMQVVLTDRDDAALKAAVRSLGEDHRPLAKTLDVTSFDDWERVVRTVWDELGGIDVLCNNAGIGVGWARDAEPLRIWDVEPATFRRILDVNLIGSYHGIRSVVPRMLERGMPGHVVMTASMAGFLAPPHLGAYASSKFGLVALSECLAGELKDTNVHVTVVCPGGVATAFNESARMLGAADGDVDAVQGTPRGPGPGDSMKMDPADVADRVVRAIRNRELYVFTHPEYGAPVAERHRSVESYFGEPTRSDYSDPPELLLRSRNPIHADPV